MRALLILLALVGAALVPATRADAAHYRHHHRHWHHAHDRVAHHWRHRHHYRVARFRHRHFRAAATAGRPRECYGIPWCGCFLRHLLGVSSRAFNLARNWAHWGRDAGGPRVGAVVVWRHHVGVIRGRAPDGRWVVLSGNDGHRVRERPRSLAGAIAFRQG